MSSGERGDPRLPMAVIGGYLGAGKTTLINRLLAEPHGRRLCVLVNDFGAIDIDAALIDSRDAQTIALSNGCVCCTLGADLFMAVGDALDRRPRPQHLLIEASGIADPARIAAVAEAEPELCYSGVATVVDAPAIAALLAEPMIAAQIAGQLAAADLLLLSKTAPSAVPAATRALLGEHSAAPVLALSGVPALAPLLLDPRPARPAAPSGGGHGEFVHWHHDSEIALERSALAALLARRPAGLYRLKGWVREPAGGGVLVQGVGARLSLQHCESLARTQLVGIGPAAAVSAAEIARWWRGAA